MLRDYLVKYYFPGNGYNYSCSEAMLRAADEYFDLKLPDKMFFAASSYSGGARHDEMCGGIASGLAVLGVLYSVNGHQHDSDKLKELIAELFQKVDEHYGTSRCKALRSRYHIPVHKCEYLLVEIADILEDIISRNPPLNNWQ